MIGKRVVAFFLLGKLCIALPRTRARAKRTRGRKTRTSTRAKARSRTKAGRRWTEAGRGEEQEGVYFT